MKCSKCGNTEKFREQYSIRHSAYVDVDSKGNKIPNTWEESSDNITEWAATYCGICNEAIE